MQFVFRFRHGRVVLPAQHGLRPRVKQRVGHRLFAGQPLYRRTGLLDHEGLVLLLDFQVTARAQAEHRGGEAA